MYIPDLVNFQKDPSPSQHLFHTYIFFPPKVFCSLAPYPHDALQARVIWTYSPDFHYIILARLSSMHLSHPKICRASSKRDRPIHYPGGRWTSTHTKHVLTRSIGPTLSILSKPGSIDLRLIDYQTGLTTETYGIERLYSPHLQPEFQPAKEEAKCETTTRQADSIIARLLSRLQGNSSTAHQANTAAFGTGCFRTN